MSTGSSLGWSSGNSRPVQPRAGTPQVIVPHSYGQFYWAQRLQELGAGAARSLAVRGGNAGEGTGKPHGTKRRAPRRKTAYEQIWLANGGGRTNSRRPLGRTTSIAAGLIPHREMRPAVRLRQKRERLFMAKPGTAPGTPGRSRYPACNYSYLPGSSGRHRS